MSIVTDALNRLQAKRSDGAHDQHAQVVSQPTLAELSTAETTPAPSEPNSSQDRIAGESEQTVPDAEAVASSDGSSGQWRIVGVGSLLLVVVAVGAFWWGRSLVADVPALHELAFELRGEQSETAPADSGPIDVAPNDQNAQPVSDADATSPEPNNHRVNVGTATASAHPPSDMEHETSLAALPVVTKADVLGEGADGSGVAQHDIQTAVPEREREMTVENGRSDEPSHVDAGKLARPNQSSDSERTEDVVSANVVVTDETGPSTATDGLSNTDSSGSERIRANSPPDTRELLVEENIAVVNVEDASPSQTDPPRLVQNAQGDIPASVESSERPAATAEDSPIVKSAGTGTKDEQAVAGVSMSQAQRLKTAQRLIEANDHEEAVVVLTPLFATPPDTWQPWFWMGTAHLGMGDLAKAEEAFMEGLVRDDTVPYLWVQRALVEQQRGKYGDAMDALRQAELYDPNLPEVQLNLAYNMESQGNHALALQHYRRYLTLTEGNATYHIVRRKVLERVLHLKEL